MSKWSLKYSKGWNIEDAVFTDIAICLNIIQTIIINSSSCPGTIQIEFL